MTAEPVVHEVTRRRESDPERIVAECSCGDWATAVTGTGESARAAVTFAFNQHRGEVPPAEEVTA